MESNSPKTTTPDFDDLQRDIPKDCDKLKKRSNVYVSSELQYKDLRNLFEICNGHYYDLEQSEKYHEKMLAELREKKAYVNSVISRSSKEVDKNNLIFNGSVVSRFNSVQKRKNPTKSQRKSAKKLANKTGSYITREWQKKEQDKKGKKGGRTRRIKK